MAEDNEEEVAESEEEVPISSSNIKKKILIILIPAIILIGAGVAAVVVFFTGSGDKQPQDYDVITQKNADGSGDVTTIFYTLPELSARLRTSSGVFETIRIKLNLELSSVEDITTINSLMPRINDILIAHLVELTPDEVSGSEGFYALKTELLHRINLMVSPVKVSNLNIKDLNIQITDALEKKED